MNKRINEMNIAAHITFFYDEKRLKYIQEVVENLLQIDAVLDIYIYTNREFNTFQNQKNIKVLTYDYTTNGIKFSFNSIFNKLGIKKMIHPYYLAWENRKVIEKQIDNYDIQLYLEDDIKFTQDNLNYWLENKEHVSEKGYNLGFLRVEISGEDKLITDLTEPLRNVITIDDRKYVINDINPYCGFWIYSKKELKEFIKSREWRFKIRGYGIREKSAVGWHGTNMKRYKGSIIPLKEEHDRYLTEDNCTVHHLPNNYINHEIFCKVKFPLIIKKEEYKEV